MEIRKKETYGGECDLLSEEEIKINLVLAAEENGSATSKEAIMCHSQRDKLKAVECRVSQEGQARFVNRRRAGRDGSNIDRNKQFYKPANTL